MAKHSIIINIIIIVLISKGCTIVDSYSSVILPTITPGLYPGYSSVSDSTGSTSLRVSHHSTCPSVEVENISVPIKTMCVMYVLHSIGISPI